MQTRQKEKLSQNVTDDVRFTGARNGALISVKIIYGLPLYDAVSSGTTNLSWVFTLVYRDVEVDPPGTLLDALHPRLARRTVPLLLSYQNLDISVRLSPPP